MWLKFTNLRNLDISERAISQCQDVGENLCTKGRVPAAGMIVQQSGLPISFSQIED